MSENFDDIFNQTQDGLNTFNQFLQKLQQFKNLDNLNNQLTLEDQAKVSAALSFALNSLYFVYMKTNGISIENHKILLELERIKKYFGKIQAQKNQLTQQDKNKGQKIKLDIESSNRMIQSHINSNTQELKRQKEEIEKEQQEEGEQKDLWADQTVQTIDVSKKKIKQSQRILKGALMPKTAHLNWREQLEKLNQK